MLLSNIYTVSFFGHRRVINYTYTEEKLYQMLCDIISKKSYVELLVGRNGEFDSIVSAAVKRVKKEYRDDNSAHICVLPYITAEYLQNQSELEGFYDEVEVYGAEKPIYYKAAFKMRNQYMVDRSDLIVFYVEEKSGGAYSTLLCAEKCNKKIINIADKER